MPVFLLDFVVLLIGALYTLRKLSLLPVIFIDKFVSCSWYLFPCGHLQRFLSKNFINLVTSQPFCHQPPQEPSPSTPGMRLLWVLYFICKVCPCGDILEQSSQVFFWNIHGFIFLMPNFLRPLREFGVLRVSFSSPGPSFPCPWAFAGVSLLCPAPFSSWEVPSLASGRSIILACRLPPSSHSFISGDNF